MRPWLLQPRWVTIALLIMAAFVCRASASRARAADSPVRKVLELLSAVEAKLIAEGESAQSVYEELAGWCEERSRNVHAEIKHAKSRSSSLMAIIEQSGYKISAVGTRIEDLSAEIAAQEKELNAATALREKESATFAKYEQGLTDTIRTMEQAIGVLEKAAKGETGASLLQRQSALDAVQAMVAIVDGYGLHAMGSDQLASLAQTTDSAKGGNADQDADSELSLDAPDSVAYQSQSGGIVNTLEGLLDKATTELADLRHDEMTKAGNYNLIKQSLDMKIGYSNKEMKQAKIELAAAGEKKATAEGDLSMGNEDLQENIRTLEKLHHHCMAEAAEFESETKARVEELSAFARAKKIVEESTAGAEEKAYGLPQRGARRGPARAAPTPAPAAGDGAASFLQLDRADRAGQSSGIGAAQRIKQLAMQRNSKSLMQLFRYMESLLRFKGSSTQDPFAKTKSMISNMIAKLEEEAAKQASRKAYCDKEMEETQAKLDDKIDDISKVSTKVDQQAAELAKITEDVSTLQTELSEIAQAQKSMDEIRAKQKALYEKEHEELEQGVQGIRNAIRVLRDYYSKDDEDDDGGSQGGASAGVLSLLEVIETDFSKSLSAVELEEETAQANYDADSKENAIGQAEKHKVVGLKSKSVKALGKSIAEMSADRDSVQSEGDAVKEFQAKLQEHCVAKADPYEEKVKRREKEMEGLKEALQILEGQVVSFLQQGASTRRQLRGVVVHKS